MEDTMRQTLSAIASLTLAALVYAFALPPVAAQQPESNAQQPPMLGPPVPNPNACSLGGPFVRIPSRNAGPEGLLVRVSPPASGRYREGAPIAVQVLAVPGVSQSRGCLSEQGFIEIGFLCPGGQYEAPDGTVWRSGGVGADQVHWENCIEPLADVLSFATGKTRSLEGKTIQNYAAGVRAMTANAGVVGWSFGGNQAVLAMALFGERFPDLKWYASWESPIRTPVDEGHGTEFAPNPFYDPATDKIDFDRLRYSSEMPIWAWYILRLPPQPDWPHGGLYLEGDANRRFNKDADFAFWVDVEIGPPLKVFYSPMVTREARDRKVFGDRWPAHIATVEEVERRENRVDAVRHIPDAVKKFPQLAVLVFESQQHHVRNSGGAFHLHATTQMNAWLDARARWVRFQPDVNYLRTAMGKTPSLQVQNPAGRRIDARTIQDLLEPEAANGGPTDTQGMSAVVSELADRTYSNNWAPMLTRVLIEPNR